MIDYKIKESTQKKLFLHLSKCDRQFVPPLNSKVNLADYAAKIARLAVTFEGWDDQELVGLVAVYRNDETQTMFITNVSVIEEYAGNGIAGTLIENAKIFSVQEGFERLALEVNNQNKKAIALYTKRGFVTEYVKDDSIFMELNLKKL